MQRWFGLIPMVLAALSLAAFTFADPAPATRPAKASERAMKPDATPAASNKVFRIWAFGDAHVGTDIRAKRESLADAIRQSEDPATGFAWDIAIDIGDNSGGQGVPEDDEGKEIVRQFGSLTKHRREQIYDVCGNHDRSGLKEEPAWWFQKWIDPMGTHTQFSKVDAKKRPFPVEGTWERYSFRAGNLLFLMMSDINEPTQKAGRGELGGNPGGVVSAETFAWWKKMVEANPDAIIVSTHHYLLKNTTTATGEWEGMIKGADGKWQSGYHGYKEKGTPVGASYLYWVGSKPDAQAFENYLEAKQKPDAPPATNAIALWLGGHTHPRNPDDTAGGKATIATKWGVQFVNVCPLTKHHINKAIPTSPMSRVFEFTEGSDEVRVRCYLHTDDYKPRGFYDKAERVLKLPRAFKGPK